MRNYFVAPNKIEFVPMTHADFLLSLGSICRKAWEKHCPVCWSILLHHSLEMRQLAYHFKYEANRGLVFQALLENWTLDQIRQVVKSYRPDLVPELHCKVL